MKAFILDDSVARTGTRTDIVASVSGAPHDGAVYLHRDSYPWGEGEQWKLPALGSRELYRLAYSLCLLAERR